MFDVSLTCSFITNTIHVSHTIHVPHASHVSRDIPSPRSERLPDRFVSEALGLDLREHYKQIKIARDRVMEEAEEAAVRFVCFVLFVLFCLPYL